MRIKSYIGAVLSEVEGRRGAEVPLPWERDIGRGHFLLHNSFRLAIDPPNGLPLIP